MTFVERKVKEYKQELPNVDIEYATATVPDHERKIITTLAAGAGFPDGFNEGEAWLAMHNDKKNLQPIPPDAFAKSSSQELEQLFHDSSLAGMKVESKLHAVPIEWNALSLYYNIKTLKSAGIEQPPQDWDALTEAALKTTERDAQGACTR
jgi:multiple sugar transport system substrate-binding protein